MALGRMRGAALAAAVAVITCERAGVPASADRAHQAIPARAGAGRHVPASRRAGRRRRMSASSRPGAAAAMTVSRFAVEPMLREIPARYAPSAGRRGLLMRAQWT